MPSLKLVVMSDIDDVVMVYDDGSFINLYVGWDDAAQCLTSGGLHSKEDAEANTWYLRGWSHVHEVGEEANGWPK